MTDIDKSNSYPIPEDKHKALTPRFFEESEKRTMDKFRSKFEEPHKKLKAAIHRCQAQAYSKQSITLEQSEVESRQCFEPLLLVRRHAFTIVQNEKDDLKSCLNAA